MSFVLLMVQLFSTFVFATPTPETWRCQTALKLAGDQMHFMYYGRDSWHGTSTMTCFSGLARADHTVDVTYNSKDVGFGADESSNVSLDLVLTTYMEPSALQILTLVNGRNRGDFIMWRVASTLSAGQVLVKSANVEALQSLERGTLFVRGASEQ